MAGAVGRVLPFLRKATVRGLRVVTDLLRTPELDLFLEGYVDGWFPDVWTTLG